MDFFGGAYAPIVIVEGYPQFALYAVAVPLSVFGCQGLSVLIALRVPVTILAVRQSVNYSIAIGHSEIVLFVCFSVDMGLLKNTFSNPFFITDSNSTLFKLKYSQTLAK